MTGGTDGTQIVAPLIYIELDLQQAVRLGSSSWRNQAKKRWHAAQKQTALHVHSVSNTNTDYKVHHFMWKQVQANLCGGIQPSLPLCDPTLKFS